MRQHFSNLLLTVFILASLDSCGQKNNADKTSSSKNNLNTTMDANAKLDTITFGGGCFWCTEALFQRLNGVFSGESGYSGGKVKTPT